MPPAGPALRPSLRHGPRATVVLLVLALVTSLALVSAPAAHAQAHTVYETSFASGTQGWFGRGSATVAVSAEQARTGAQSLHVTGRAQGWHGPALDANPFLTPGATYEVEAHVRLAAGSGSQPVNLSVARTPIGGSAAFDTIAWGVPVTDAGWTRVGGAYTFGTTNAQLELYLESPNPDLSFFVDDVRIVRTAEADPDPDPGTRTDIATNFEDGTRQGWGPRGGGVTVTPTTADAHEGTYSLLTAGRTEGWHGPTIDVTEGLAVGEPVDIALWAKLAPGQAPANLQVSIQRDRGATTSYEWVSGASGTVTADAWVQLRGSYTLGSAIDRAQLYVEGPAGVSFLIDDFTLVGRPIVPIQQDIPSLQDVLAPHFDRVGVAIDQRETVGQPAQLLLKHFNAISAENDAKPESVQPREGQFTFGNLDRLLDFADANDLEVYGHVLVWHDQTPGWFFLRLDGSPMTGTEADQALLLQRMEDHIAGIAAHIDARYPDGDSPIWAWDVVNEVIADQPTGNVHNMRDSRWFQILGEEFVDHAFHLARQHFPDAVLFINDYNTEFPEKRANYFSLISALVERGVPIDGVGHQAHVNIDRPISWLEDSIRLFRELPLVQAITELDVSLSTSMQEWLPEPPEDRVVEVGYYYRDLFDMLRRHGDVIESVTVWGLYDARSWLRYWPQERPQEAPLLFDDDLQANPAYWGIVDPSQLPRRVLRPDVKDDCKADGWRSYAALEFRNQGQCVSWVNAAARAA